MAEDDGLRALEAQVGAPAPASFRTLDAADLADLAAAVNDVRRRQAAELAQAGERALGHIPKLLRAPVRKALG